MTEDTQQKDGVTGVHPTPGYLAVVLLTLPGDEKDLPEVVQVGPGIFGVMGLEKLTQRGIRVGIIVELGGVIPGQPEGNFDTGDKVFFTDDRGIEIGDRMIVSYSSILAYKKESED